MVSWVGEENRKLGISLKLLAEEIFYRGHSKYFSSIIIGRSKAFGKFLVLEEKGEPTLQITEKWDTYSEMLVHVPMCAHANPKKILIVGGGDGATLREVLKHKSVEEVILIEIDREVIDKSKKYLKVDNGAFESEKVKIINMDAVEFLNKESLAAFDVIIGDYSDPYPEYAAYSLLSRTFYDRIKNITSKNGIISVQSGSPFLQPEILKATYKIISKVFNKSYIYLAPVPFYPGGLWSFITASDVLDPRVPKKIIDSTIYYNEKIHEASFVLPSFIKKEILSEDL
ncbi:MAG: fused MFS/spermidine synthase [Candidatus Njordarchaeia archaeon]|nr:fused MFS/spermidine synthase [Candidatus Korarchaeota archaeon]